MASLIYKVNLRSCFRLHEKFPFKSNNALASFFFLALQQNIRGAFHNIQLVYSHVMVLAGYTKKKFELVYFC